MQHEAASLWTLGLDHELQPLTLPARASLDDLINLLAALIQNTKLHPDLSPLEGADPSSSAIRSSTLLSFFVIVVTSERTEHQAVAAAD